MKWFGILGCFFLLANLLGLPRVNADEPAKPQFQTVSWENLLSKTEDKGPRLGSYSIAYGLHRSKPQTIVEALNSHGAKGWEVCLWSDMAVTLRRSKVPQNWEYKVVRATTSPLAGQKGEE